MLQSLRQAYFTNKISKYFDLPAELFDDVFVQRLRRPSPLVHCCWTETGVYKHQRKDGKKDRRYKNNWLLPVMTFLVIQIDNDQYCLCSETEIDILEIARELADLGILIKFLEEKVNV